MAGGWCMCVRLLMVLFMLPSGLCLYRQIPLVNTPSVTCDMSSIYYKPEHGTSLDCKGAINGNTGTTWRNKDDPNANCAYTTAGDASTYWQVNLGSSRNIRKITIYPVAGFYGDIQDVRVLIGSNEVSRFPPSGVTSPQVFSVASNGQIIRLQQNPNRHLGLCEIQVEDCKAGDFGTDCSQTCSTGCSNTCDTISGNCTCKAGWTGAQCQVCTSGYYKQGDNCVPCGDGCQGGTCNVTGHCTCNPGWQPTQCHTRCKGGTYGQDCLQTCSAGCQNTCDAVNGNCTCTTGWAGLQCQRCSAGYHNTTNVDSAACKECGLGCDNGSCDDFTGNCTCRSGWQPPTCLVVSSSVDPESYVGRVAGGVVGGAVALIVVVVVIVFIIRRQRQGSVKKPAYSGASGDENPVLSSLQPGESSCALSTGAPQRPQVKPKVEVKPMKRNTSDTPQQPAGAGHVYSNTGGDGTTGGNVYGNHPSPASNGATGAAHSAHTRHDGARRSPPDPDAPPSVPQRAAGVGRVYENVTVPPRNEQLSATDNAHSRPGRRSYRTQRSESEGDLGEGDENDVYNSEDIYSSAQSVASQHFDPFQSYLIKCLSSGQLAAQFAKLPKGMKHPHEAGMTDENRCKNRFKAICAYDFNRVMLIGKPDSSSDYINASYIKGADENSKRYIATQGPRDNTVGDLWWMIWQEGVTQVVMLTNIKEDGKDKCEEYWPASGHSETYDHVTVRGLEEQQRADFVIRPFTIKVAGQKPREVTQYHYNSWPDHGVPQAASLVDFWRYVKGRNNAHVPLLVHCSAGVGRTGTYIALDMAFDPQSRGHDVNVNKLVTQLREERCLMVQSEAQYAFLHEVILEAHTSRATRVPVTECDVIFPGTVHIDSENARIDKEFQMLHDMGQFFPKPKHTMANMLENVDKNRNMDALPDDEHIVYLGAHVRGRNQYINGVYLSSFRHRRGFILTQLPLSDTVVDFWRLVDGCDVTTVVSIGSADEERSVKDYCHFWPRQVHEVLTTGPYTITLNSVVSAGDHLASNKMTLKATTEDTGRQVEIFHYKNWVGQVTGDTSSLLHLVDTVKAILSKDSTSPVMVQCIDGAAKSGLFCALCDVISRVTSDIEVDVYLTARQVQRVRPQAVATQTQYRFLYKCVQDYIRHQDVYQNADVTQNRY